MMSRWTSESRRFRSVSSDKPCCLWSGLVDLRIHVPERLLAPDRKYWTIYADGSRMLPRPWR